MVTLNDDDLRSPTFRKVEQIVEAMRDDLRYQIANPKLTLDEIRALQGRILQCNRILSLRQRNDSQGADLSE